MCAMLKCRKLWGKAKTLEVNLEFISYFVLSFEIKIEIKSFDLDFYGKMGPESWSLNLMQLGWGEQT